jgi:hypothetical protein
MQTACRWTEECQGWSAAGGWFRGAGGQGELTEYAQIPLTSMISGLGDRREPLHVTGLWQAHNPQTPAPHPVTLTRGTYKLPSDVHSLPNSTLSDYFGITFLKD